MNSGIIQLSIWHLVIAYVLLAALIALIKFRGLGLEGELTLASFRMTVQLVLVGYILQFVFDRPAALITLLIFIIMEGFAIQNVYGRVKAKLSRALRRVIGGSLAFGTTFSLFYFLLAVVGLHPWYDPRYFIPLGGMIVGNSMTGIALGAERLHTGLLGNADEVEGALMLGATPADAARPFVKRAFGAAVMPTVNSMMGMGIVFLPGMMTGQILSGTSPVTAIEYQIAIMVGIGASVILTVYVMTEFGYRTYFNAESQLIARSEEELAS